MKINDDKIREQMARYLANNSSPDEQKALQEWVERSEKNKQQLTEATLIWKMMDQYKQQEPIYNADRAWENVKNSIQHRERQRGMKTKRITVYTSVAAILLLAMFVLYNVINSNTHIQVADAGDMKTVTLSDGSTISLNSRSSITYPEPFSDQQTRTVQLTGEAYFEIERDPDKPFVVITDEAEIRVLGTSFNVNAYDHDHTEVTVAIGKVSVSRNNKDALTVLQDELAVITKKQVIKQQNTNLNYLAWKTKKFTFNNTELQEVAREIERVYHCNIEFSNDVLKQCRLTAVFDNEELDDIIQTICLAFNVQAELDNDQYILSGQGCE